MASKPITSPAVSHSESGATKSVVAQYLRRRIVAGDFPPGSKLPTRSTLEQHFGTTKVTVQRAFNDLSLEGFIRAEGNKGTFVSSTPPHLTRYALVFPHERKPKFWTFFWDSLCAEASRLREAGERHIQPYFGVAVPGDGDYALLLREVKELRLAGLIFAFTPEHFQGSELFEACTAPVVNISQIPSPTGITTVGIDYFSFFDKALDELAARGRKEIALLAPDALLEDFTGYFLEGVKRRGLNSRPYWVQPANLSAPESARPHVHLLMNPEQRARPDGLIVANDQFVRHVASGLGDAGVRVPSDLEIVAHCNFPLQEGKPSGDNDVPLDVTRLGFDIPRVLHACLHSVDTQRARRPVPLFTPISARFENETGPHLAP